MGNGAKHPRNNSLLHTGADSSVALTYIHSQVCWSRVSSSFKSFANL